MDLSHLSHPERLAVEAWQLIKNHPEQWRQEAWRSPDPTRCGTQLCWGGHVVALDGGIWVTDDPCNGFYNHVIARPGESEWSIRKIHAEHDLVFSVISVEGRLTSLFGISPDQMFRITSGDNTITDIRRAIINVLGIDPSTGERVSKPEKVSTCYCGNPACVFGV